jgi:hypothetical protein
MLEAMPPVGKRIDRARTHCCMVSLRNQSSSAMSFLCLLYLNGHRHGLTTSKTQRSQAATTATAP